MEFVIVMLSVPLFLLGVLLFALFVLPRYPRHTQAETTASLRSAPGTNTSPNALVGVGVTLLLCAPFVVALCAPFVGPMLSGLKLNKEK